MFTENIKDIQAVIIHYFEGIYYGDMEKLSNCFHSNCFLYGDIKGEHLQLSVSDYLVRVKERQSPHQLGETYDMKILSVDVLGNNAVVKVQMNMLGYQYTDFLSFNKEKEHWKIVNKLFTNLK